MANRQNINEILEESMSVWRREGFDPCKSDDPNENESVFFKLQNDPVVRLLVGAVATQTDAIEKDIESFRQDVKDIYTDIAAPGSMLMPSASMGMLQTKKRHKVGTTNAESTRLDGNSVFYMLHDNGMEHIKYPFIPLLNITVFDLSVKSVEQLSRVRWKVELEENENVSSLDGLSIYIPKLRSCDGVKLFSNGEAVSVCNVYEYDRLPFVTPFLKGIQFSKNNMQSSAVQNLHDNLCCGISSYCIVDCGTNASSLLRVDGCIVLEIEFESDNVNDDFVLNEGDILLNCVPVFNAHIHKTSLSQSSPIQKLDLEEEYFLATVTPFANTTLSDAVIVRNVGTERMSPALWLKQMKHLMDYYDFEYNVMNHILDDKVEKLMRQFMSAVKETISKRNLEDKSKYMILRDRLVSSIDVDWISTSGASANGLDVKTKIECASAELDDEGTKLITRTMGGRDAVMDRQMKQYIMQYYQLSRDRIVSKSDIILFCRFKLQQLFDLKEKDVKEMRIRNDVYNSRDGFYERLLVVEIKVKKGCVDVCQAQMSLERMIKSRTMSTTTIRVAISEID